MVYYIFIFSDLLVINFFLFLCRLFGLFLVWLRIIGIVLILLKVSLRRFFTKLTDVQQHYLKKKKSFLYLISPESVDKSGKWGKIYLTPLPKEEYGFQSAHIHDTHIFRKGF
jgi:hypothetical protein